MPSCAELKDPDLLQRKYDLTGDPVYQQLNAAFWQQVIDNRPPAVTEKVNDALGSMIEAGKTVYTPPSYPGSSHAFNRRG